MMSPIRETGRLVAQGVVGDWLPLVLTDDVYLGHNRLVCYFSFLEDMRLTHGSEDTGR